MISAVIFDMDGVIIDSEPLWRDSEMSVFQRVGINLTHDDCLKTTGLRTDEVVDYWHRQHPWVYPSKKVIAQEIVEQLIGHIRSRGKLIEGFESAMAFIQTRQVKTALASSSSYPIIDTVMDRFNLREHFEVIHSAQEEEYGKPHPAVYMTTARKMNVRGGACLAIEDSVNGAVAAKAAGMRCIALPDPDARHDRRFGIADAVVDSLTDIDETLWQRLDNERISS